MSWDGLAVDRQALALPLVLASALIASLVSLALKILTNTQSDGGMELKWSALTASTGLLGAIVCGITLRVKRIQMVSEARHLWKLHLRGLLGGIAMTSGFFAIQMTNLAVANTLMFTMPMWTGIFSYFIVAKPWSRFDFAITTTSLVGVLLVASPWGNGGYRGCSDSSPEATGSQLVSNPILAFVGYVAALNFGVMNSLAALLVHSQMRNESALAMTFFAMLYTFCFGTFFSLAIPQYNHNHFGDALWDLLSSGNSSEGNQSFKIFLVLSLGIGMCTQQGLRNAGIAFSRDSTVVVALYVEVALAFFWNLTVLQDCLNPYQYSGATIIVIGCTTFVILRHVDEKQHRENDAESLISHDGPEQREVEFRTEQSPGEDTSQDLLAKLIPNSLEPEFNIKADFGVMSFEVERHVDDEAAEAKENTTISHGMVI